VIGIAPSELKRMSLWEFYAMRAGWIAANTSPETDKGGGPLTDSEFKRLAAFVDTVQ
jgi:hypothetical protein